MAATTPPDLLVANVTPLTTEFIVVLGVYNFAIAKSVGIPVVGLPEGCWHPDYRYFYPFSTVRRAELIITRTMAPSTATTEIPLSAEMKRAAALSADYATNMRAVTAIAIDKWARPRFRIANGGVLAVSQQKYRANDPFACEEYRKQFHEFPKSDREVVQLCKPPRSDTTPPLPMMPMAATPHEWATMSPEQQAAILYQWEHLWQHHTPAAGPMRARDDQVVIEIPDETVVPDGDWKGRPSPEALADLRSNSWKRW